MKFVHIADIHFDRPFVNLSTKENVGDLKRLEQRKIFKQIITYIQENSIDVLFIAGDLYEEAYVKKSTIDYINELFKQIPNTKIFIAPGNHDPKIKESYYNTYKWSKNVKIFTSKIEKVELEDDINIYGYGFDNYYCTNCGIEDFEIANEDKEKINILTIHATLDGASLDDMQYNSIPKKELESKGFDYIALGHIHKSNFDKQNKIIYPGSPNSLRFEKEPKNGMVVGEIKKDIFNLDFVELEQVKFEELDIDVTLLNSEEELIEKIDYISNQNKNLLKILLVGNRKFEIDIVKIKKLVLNQNVIKIEDNTKLEINLEQIQNDFTLKGMFAKQMKQKLENAKSKEEKRTLEKAIEIGLDALN